MRKMRGIKCEKMSYPEQKTNRNVYPFTFTPFASFPVWVFLWQFHYYLVVLFPTQARTVFTFCLKCMFVQI